MLVQNLDQRPHDYSEMDLYPRPSHADWTYLQKYGVKASSGGGRSSARETIGISLLMVSNVRPSCRWRNSREIPQISPQHRNSRLCLLSGKNPYADVLLVKWCLERR